MSEQEIIKGIDEMKLTYKDNPTEILEKLLEHHDIKTLRGILNKKVKKVPRKFKSDYLTVAVDVYRTQNENNSTLDWATNKVAEDRSTEEKTYEAKTVKNHIVKFRKEIREEMEKLELNIKSNEDVNEFIYAYIQSVDYRMKEHEDHDYYYMESLDREYRKVLKEYLSKEQENYQRGIQAEDYRRKQEQKPPIIDIDLDKIPF